MVTVRYEGGINYVVRVDGVSVFGSPDWQKAFAVGRKLGWTTVVINGELYCDN